MRCWIIAATMVCFLNIGAQDLVHYQPMKAEPQGGSAQVEQVLETQLSFPKNFFQSGYHDNVNIYFNVDSVGHAQNVAVRGDIHNKACQKELTRIMNFLTFLRQDPDPKVPYLLTVHIDKEKYNGYLKQRFKGTIRNNRPADSSFVIHTRADRSPEFYKNGEEGLKEYIMDHLEYPKVAIDKGVEGTVILEFIVETNGFVTSIAPKHMVGAGCTDEAVRLVRKLRWQPAELNGKFVRYRMTYPITFSLRNANHDNGFSNPTVGN